MNPKSLSNSNVPRKMGLASLIMMASVLLSRIIGLAREMVIAHLAGASKEVDAYQIAFIIPEILNHIVASGFLSITFVPLFLRYITKGQHDTGWEIFSIIINTFSTILIFLCIVAFVMAHKIVPLLAPGMQDGETINQAVHLTRIIIPAQIFFFWGGLFNAVQYSKETFILPALSPLIYNTCIILGGLTLYSSIGMEGLAWGVLIGAFLGSCVLQFYGCLKQGMKWFPKINFTHPEFKKYLLLTLPLIFGMTMTFFNEIVFKVFGSFLPPGSISALNYALRLMFVLVGIFGQAIGVASYPFIAKLVTQNNFTEVNRLLNNTIKRCLTYVIPASCLFLLLRYEVILILFQRGNFDSAATMMTAKGLGFLLVGTFAFALQTIVVRGFYASSNTLLPTIITTSCSLASLPVYYLATKYYGLKGLAASMSLATFFQVLLLYIIWNKKNQNLLASTVYRYFLKISLVSAASTVVTFWVKSATLPFQEQGLWVSFQNIAGTSILFIPLFLILARIFQIREISEFLFYPRAK